MTTYNFADVTVTIPEGSTITVVLLPHENAPQDVSQAAATLIYLGLQGPALAEHATEDDAVDFARVVVSEDVVVTHGPDALEIPIDDVAGLIGKAIIATIRGQAAN